MKKTKSTFAFIFGIYIITTLFGLISTMLLGVVSANANETLHLALSFILSSAAMFGACYIMAERYYLPASSHRLMALVVSIEVVLALIGVVVGILVFQGLTSPDLEITRTLFTPDIVLTALGVFVLTTIVKSAIAYFTFVRFGTMEEHTVMSSVSEPPVVQN